MDEPSVVRTRDQVRPVFLDRVIGSALPRLFSLRKEMPDSGTDQVGRYAGQAGKPRSVGRPHESRFSMDSAILGKALRTMKSLSLLPLLLFFVLLVMLPFVFGQYGGEEVRINAHGLVQHS